MKRALPLVVAIASCVPAIPPHTAHVPPRLDEVRPARSVAFVETDVPLDPLREALERAVPARLDGQREVPLGALGTAQVTWALARTPPRVHAATGGLEAELTLAGTVGVEGRLLKCRAPDAGVAVDVVARPVLAPDGWLILGAPTVKLRPEGTLSCAGIPLPIGQALAPALAPLQRAVEEAVKLVRLPLGPLARYGLDALAKPRAWTLDGEPACLDLDPQALVLAPGGAGESFSLRFGADVAPRVSTGACPEARPASRRELVARDVPLGDQFRVEVALAVPYDDLARRARPALVGQSFGEGRNRVVVRDLELADAGGRVLVRAEVDGAIRGVIWLWGTPALALRNGRAILHLPDLQVAVETREVLTRLKLWAWERFDGGLPVWLRGKLALDLTDRLESARRGLDGRHVLVEGTPALALVARLGSLQPVGVASRPGALTARVQLVGSASLELR